MGQRWPDRYRKKQEKGTTAEIEKETESERGKEIEKCVQEKYFLTNDN